MQHLSHVGGGVRCVLCVIASEPRERIASPLVCRRRNGRLGGHVVDSWGQHSRLAVEAGSTQADPSAARLHSGMLPGAPRCPSSARVCEGRVPVTLTVQGAWTSQSQAVLGLCQERDRKAGSARSPAASGGSRGSLGGGRGR